MIVAEGKSMREICGPLIGLQWGRNLIVAEGTILRKSGFEISGLQWGRNLIVAEGQADPPQIRR